MKIIAKIAKYFLIFVFISYLLNTLWVVLVNASVSNENEFLQGFTVFYMNLTGTAFLRAILKSASWLLPITVNDIPVSYKLQPIFAAIGLVALGLVNKSVKWVFVLFAVILIIFVFYYLPFISHVGVLLSVLAAIQFLVLNFATYLLYRHYRNRAVLVGRIEQINDSQR